jgi:hypothetical protein
LLRIQDPTQHEHTPAARSLFKTWVRALRSQVGSWARGGWFLAYASSLFFFEIRFALELLLNCSLDCLSDLLLCSSFIFFGLTLFWCWSCYLFYFQRRVYVCVLSFSMHSPPFSTVVCISQDTHNFRSILHPRHPTASSLLSTPLADIQRPSPVAYDCIEHFFIRSLLQAHDHPSKSTIDAEPSYTIGAPTSSMTSQHQKRTAPSLSPPSYETL